MRHLLLAVLVPGAATTATVDVHLAAPLRPLVRAQVIDGYHLGCPATGGTPASARSVSDERSDPGGGSWRRWWPRTCRSRQARDIAAGGRARLRLVHPGDLVALPVLFSPNWRFPAQATPHAWVDLAGVVWLGTDARHVLGTDDGTVPTRLRTVLDDLTAGRRQPDPASPEPLDPCQWRVALVHASQHA